MLTLTNSCYPRLSSCVRQMAVGRRGSRRYLSWFQDDNSYSYQAARFHHSQYFPSSSSSSSSNTRCFSSSIPNKEEEKSFRCAIVGSGPSGFYTAKYLLSAFEKRKGQSCTVDILERLPTPYGLVRYGVAPDHPEVKNVENDFAALFSKYEQNLNLMANVPVGDCVSVNELREMYDAVVLSYGCESDRKLGLPGEQDLSGILSAREFVAWYNGHPYFEHIGEQVANALASAEEDSNNKKEVVVIGQGNVALDCARILAKGGRGLHDTDISSRALPVIGDDGIATVTVVGRRGHVQGAFTIKELRELTKLGKEGYGVRFVVNSEELDLGATPSSQEELSTKAGRPKVRIDKLLRDAAAEAAKEEGDYQKEVRLRFLMSPKQFEPSESNPSSVGAVVCERTKLEGEPGKQVAVGTGTLESIPAQLVLVSIGYKGAALPGIEQWFDDQRGIVKNSGGIVDSGNSSLAGLYVAGWLKRGPSGIIGTNIMDAKDTVINMVKDFDAPEGEFGQKSDATDKLNALLKERGVSVVTWSDFQKIDAEETSAERKRSDTQPREKITEMKDLLGAAFSS